MINRKKKSHSYDKTKNRKQNKNNSDLKKDSKRKFFFSPKTKKEIQEQLLDTNEQEKEEERQPSEINIKEKKDLIIKNNKNIDYTQNDNIIKSSELRLNIEKEKKDMIDISNKEKNEGKENTLNFIKDRSYYNNKYNNLEKENENNNSNHENNNSNDIYKNEIKNKDFYNHSLIDFRHSNYAKYKREREKNKKIYISKRFNNFEDILQKKPKEIKIYKPKEINDNIHYKIKKDYINELFLKKKEENKKSNADEESSRTFQKIEDNYIEENSNEIRKVDITGYRYKIKNRPKQLELKNEILEEINNIKNKLLINENYQKNKEENDNNVIHRKIEINTTIESDNKFLNDKNSKIKSYDYRINSEDKYNSLDQELKEKIINNYIKNKRFKTLSKKKYEKNNMNSPPIFNYNTGYDATYSNNINNTYDIYNQNIEDEKQQNPIIKNNKIKLNNLSDYKYIYYINKKNRKLKKMNIGNNTNKLDEINKLFNDLMKIKNSKKKRFHRSINQIDEDI